MKLVTMRCFSNKEEVEEKGLMGEYVPQKRTGNTKNRKRLLLSQDCFGYSELVWFHTNYTEG